MSRGEGATSPNLQVWISPAASSSPSPLDEKEKEILKNNRILEVKRGDSEKVDSESKGVTRADSKIVDCHADKSARNDKRTQSQADSKSVDYRTDTPAHNDEKTESRGRVESAMVRDSEKRWLGDSRRSGIL